MSALKSFSFRRLLYNKRFTIPLSLALSFILWIVITVNQKPTIDRTFSDMTVTINMENTFVSENGMSIIGDISNQRFTVSVMGQNSVVSSLTQKDINLYASAAQVDAPGVYDLTVSAANATSDFDVLSITPKTVKVEFDYIETREFTVEALAEGAVAAEGLVAEAAVVSGVESNNISVTGPRTVINSIEKVRAWATVNKTLSQSETFGAILTVYDEKGKEINSDDLEYSIEKVEITVPISKRKTVPVKVDFANVPKGFSKSSLKCKVDHAKVTIIGAPDAVDGTKEITLAPIDITTLTAKSNKFKVAPVLPEGVRLLDSIESFVVTVDLTDYTERVINVSKVRITGLSKGLKSGKTGVIKNVRICGPKSLIDSFKASKAYAVVDLSKKKAGDHIVPVTIHFDGGKKLWAIGTYETTVTIK